MERHDTPAMKVGRNHGAYKMLAMFVILDHICPHKRVIHGKMTGALSFGLDMSVGVIFFGLTDRSCTQLGRRHSTAGEEQILITH